MRKELWTQLKDAHPVFWNESGDELPDGWSNIIDQFLLAIAEIGDPAECVAVHFQYRPSGLRALAWPKMEQWTGDQTMALITAQRQLYSASHVTCEQCGQPGHRRKGHPKMRSDYILCHACATAWQARQAAVWGDDDET